MEGISFQTDSDLTSLSAVVDESLQHSSDITEGLESHKWDSDQSHNCWKD